ncbi:MAG: hypothetical protein AAGA67_02780, partial [Cyanobacteria bacterium P01_F01_bin.153]
HVFPLRRCLMPLSATVANNVLSNDWLLVGLLLFFVPSFQRRLALQQDYAEQNPDQLCSLQQRWTRVLGPSEVKASL